MTERVRVLLQAAFVSAIVGATAAAAVTRCGGKDDVHDARERERLPPPPTLTSAQLPPAVDELSETLTPTLAPTPPEVAAEIEELDAAAAVAEPPELHDAGVPPTEAERAEDASVDGDVAATRGEELGADAGPADAEAPYEALFRGPTFSAGAGAFLTEPPPWAASAMTPNLDAGAGAFLTTPEPWAASAMTANPEAGAGPFTTERSWPGDLGYFFGLPPFLFVPPPPEP